MRWLVFLLAFALLACGGDDPADSPGTTDPAPSGTEDGGLKSLGTPAPGTTPKKPDTPEKPKPPADPVAELMKSAEKGIRSSDPDVVLEAIGKLAGDVGDKDARARLIARTLENEDDDVRLLAVESLTKLKVKSVAPNLEAMMATEEEPTIRKQIIQALYELQGKDCALTLVKVLEDEDEHYNTRATAAQLLGKIKSDLGVRPLMETLENDFNAAVRRECVVALAEMKAMKSEDLMIEALKDEDTLVRTEAAKALGKFKSKKAAGPLVDALDPDEEDEVHVLEAVSRALGKIAGFDKEDMEDYLYDPDASQAKKDEVVQNWRDWWEENQAEYK